MNVSLGKFPDMKYLALHCFLLNRILMKHRFSISVVAY